MVGGVDEFSGVLGYCGQRLFKNDDVSGIKRSLFYLGNWDMEFFSWIHLYLWPALIMLDVLIVFIVYLRYLTNLNNPVEAALG